MKAKAIWELLPNDALVIFTVQGEIVANMWHRDCDSPELLEKEILEVAPLERRVLCIEVAQ